MSGHKRATITISPEEYRKLHNAEMSMRFMNSHTSGNTKEERQDIQSHLMSGMEAMQSRQQLLMETLNDISSDILIIEEQTGQMILEQQRNISEEITYLLSDYQVETDVALKSIEQQLMVALQKALDDVNQSRVHIQQVWEQHAENHQQSVHIASEWIRAVEALIQFIQLNYEHDRFAPGILEYIDGLLQQAKQNLVQNLPEAAISTAQTAYNNLSNLRVELEGLHNQFIILREQINKCIQSFRQLVDANQEVPALDIEGKPIPYSIAVDFWTEGQLSIVVEEFNKTAERVLENLDSIEITYLREFVENYYPSMARNITDLVFQARLKAIYAQIRVNIAEIVVNALSSQGYFLARSFFDSNDERTSYQAILYNYEGSRIIVRLEPGTDQKGSSELHLYAKDRQVKTQHESRQRALEIQRALQGNGLQVGEVTTIENETQIPHLRNQRHQSQIEHIDTKEEKSLRVR